MYSHVAKTVRRKTVYYADPRDRQVGTIPVGTILYIQDGVSPFKGLTRDVVQREPWIVEAWLPRDYAKWDGVSRTFKTVRIRGGHLAVVRSLRDRRRRKTVADGYSWPVLMPTSKSSPEHRALPRLFSTSFFRRTTMKASEIFAA